MSRRIRQKDTQADLDLYACISTNPPRSFTMVAGAGSGKTTSLIKALGNILSSRGEMLKLHRQKVACITYTDIAAGEIWADVGNNQLVHVSTIHSFLWSLIRSFQTDIRTWASNRIDEKLRELGEAGVKFGPRTQQRTRDKNQRDIVRFEQQRAKISQVRSFTYGTGSDYANGILGHNDIIKIAPQFLLERQLMRVLLSHQYPFLFVDESQDTFEDVVRALKAVEQEPGVNFCLGFFGDPMQRIYLTGVGSIPPEQGWATITKPENFRCSAAVLAVANSVRRDADGLVQTRGRIVDRDGSSESVAGSAHIFILPIDNRRDERLAKIRTWMAARNADPGWQANGKDGVKI